MKTASACFLVLGLGSLVACGDDGSGTSNEGGSSPTTATTGNTVATSSTTDTSTNTTGSGGAGGGPVVCTDGTQADCVACGASVCGLPEVCCSDGAAPACAADCELAFDTACDGAEDCPGMECCIDVDLFQNDPQGAVSSCGSCTISGGSSGIQTVACRAQTDCAGVQNGNGVSYSECCFIPGHDVGACVSETSAFVDFDDNCNM